MLQFWKKTGSKEGNKSNPPSPITTTPPSTPFIFNGLCSRPNSDCHRSGPLAAFEDEGLFDLCETEIPKQHSRLSKTLDDVLEDKSALGYFAQYLESRGGLPYIHCWLDIEQFKLDAQKELESTIEETDMTNVVSPLPSTKVDHDSLSVSTDCDSYTGDSYSLCEYSSCTISDMKVSADIMSPCDRVKLDISYNSCDNNNSNDASHTVNFGTGRNEIYSSSYKGDKTGEEKRLKSPTHNKSIQRITDEALRVFKTYVSLEAAESIKCSEEIRKEVIENICDTSKILKLNCFEKVETFIRELLEKEFFHTFLGSDYFCKHQIDMLTSGNIILDDILYNETALFYFMEFLEQESHRSLLEFWIAASNFHMQLNQQKDFFDPIEAQSDAVVLYDRYFSLQAHCPLGFSDKIRFAVEQNICGENGVMLDCFHLPLKIVEQVLQKNYFKSFIVSQLFYKYLSELINSVHNSGYFNSPDGSRYAQSDCSSEKSFGTNTFLAMHLPKGSQKKEKGTDMNIDTRQLYDPDSLWKRKTNHRLLFGRVTSLGKYETDFEPEPDKSMSSRLKTVVKKFVNLEEDKKKEEMAWQVAEMIVKDITNITLQEKKSFEF